MSIVKRAFEFAASAHQSVGQKRKYTGEDYIVHPSNVAGIVRDVTDDEATISAAYLHDVLEDTPVTFEELREQFGTEIAGLVREVTDVSRPEDGNRAARKALDRAHLAAASPKAQTVKLADLLDNAIDIAEHDKEFAVVYIKEARLCLDILKKGDNYLRQRLDFLLSGIEHELAALRGEI